MLKGTIIVDENMKTNLEDVYAAGDCVMVKNRITGQPQWSPMGSSGESGRPDTGSDSWWKQRRYPGVLWNRRGEASRTEYWSNRADGGRGCAAGYDVITVVAPTDDKAHYYPDASFFITKLIADRASHSF